MKFKFVQILCSALLSILPTIADAQNETSPSPVLIQAPTQEADVPPPPPAPQEQEEIFKVVEQMPRFPGCEDQNLLRKKLELCAKNKLIKYIADNLIYPEEAKKKGIEGAAVIQFIVDKDGSILKPKIVRDLGQGCKETCGDAALKVFKKMQSELKWVSGKQRGRSVKVQYTIPVKFRL